mgnify:CR=1 FL=1
MTQNIYLANDATDEVYYISNLNNLNWSIDTPVTPMPLPEDTHEENILVKMEGNTAKIDISWTLDEGAYFGTLNSSNVSLPFITLPPIKFGKSNKKIQRFCS